MKAKMCKYVVSCGVLFIFGCTSTNENKEELKKAIFTNFQPLKMDSITYFNLGVDSGRVTYKFTTIINERTPFFTNIGYGEGFIEKLNNSIYISPRYKNHTLNIDRIELFNYNLKNNETKKCSFGAKDGSHTYQLSLRDTDFSSSDSIYWFRIQSMEMINCEVSNYFVSKKKGLLAVFESLKSDSAFVISFNEVGKIPEIFRNKIKKEQGETL